MLLPSSSSIAPLPSPRSSRRRVLAVAHTMKADAPVVAAPVRYEPSVLRVNVPHDDRSMSVRGGPPLPVTNGPV